MTGLSAMFAAAFTQSRNAMVLVDEQRRHVEVNAAYLKLLGYRRDLIIGRPVFSFVAGGPLASPGEWRDALAEGRFTGEAELICADGDHVGVQFAGTSEIVTSRRLVLFVVLSTSRWGAHFRRSGEAGNAGSALSGRELEIVRHVALGSSGPEIAEELGIAHDTVRTHIRNSMDKLDARSRAHLVAKAVGEGLILREVPSG